MSQKPQSSPEGDSWLEYKRLVLAELKRGNDGLEALQQKLSNFKAESAKQISDLKVEVGMLKVKAGVWGALGGIVPAAISIIYMMASK